MLLAQPKREARGKPEAPVAVERGLSPKRRPGEDPQAVASLPDDRGLAPLVANAERELGELGAPARADDARIAMRGARGAGYV